MTGKPFPVITDIKAIPLWRGQGLVVRNIKVAVAVNLTGFPSAVRQRVSVSKASLPVLIMLLPLAFISPKVIYLRIWDLTLAMSSMGLNRRLQPIHTGLPYIRTPFPKNYTIVASLNRLALHRFDEYAR
ncbi:MAG TPA: hypothetical protein VFD89_05745 [Clostridia bacterium]|nr:hypothetical protein [Clostridia bacterium]